MARRGSFGDLRGKTLRTTAHQLVLAQLALKVERERQLKTTLHQARNAMDCDEQGPWPGPDSEGEPCWKRHTGGDYEHTPEQIPQEEWCDSCRARQKVHDELTATRRRLGLARRQMTAYAGRILAEQAKEDAAREQRRTPA